MLYETTMFFDFSKIVILSSSFFDVMVLNDDYINDDDEDGYAYIRILYTHNKKKYLVLVVK